MTPPKDKLDTYRGKRDARKTPEPVPEAGPQAQQPPVGNDDTFVVHEHHARRLHWDFRLERDGVLVSWAVPKGLPLDPKSNHLAVHTEDHPLEYATFAGDIPAGQYGGGKVTIWDHGTYSTEKWRADEVIVTLHGQRRETSDARFVLFRTRDDDWIIHRMSPPPHPDWQPLPEVVRPMLAKAGALPDDPGEADAWAYEMKWDGVRAVVYIEGGRARVLTRNDREVAATYPELRALAASVGTRQLILDGEIVAFDDAGRPSFGTLQQRMHVTNPAGVRSLLKRVPVSFLAFDVLHVDGRDVTGLSYDQRRALLESLELDGPSWGTPPVFLGHGTAAFETSRGQGLEGVIAKRRDSRYEPGLRTGAWLKIKHVRTQEVVVAGWKPGSGRRAGGIGSLLLGVYAEEGLIFAGHVGTGFTNAALEEVARRLQPTERTTSPFSSDVPRLHARDAHWVSPKYVGEVAFTEWTEDGLMRHPSWRGWRPDKSPQDAVRAE